MAMAVVVNCNKLALGTVQWGLAYGVGNFSGCPSMEELGQMLSHARGEGVSLIDTARTYGDAESRIGKLKTEGVRIVTKMPPLPNIEGQGLDEFLHDTFSESLRNLNATRVHGYLVHRSTDIVCSHGRVVRTFLENLRSTGKAAKVGVSIYERKEIQEVLQYFQPDIVQLPLNVLDQRLLHDGSIPNRRLVANWHRSRYALSYAGRRATRTRCKLLLCVPPAPRPLAGLNYAAGLPSGGLAQASSWF